MFLDREAFFGGFLRQQASSDQHARIRGIGARGDGRDQDVARTNVDAVAGLEPLRQVGAVSGETAVCRRGRVQFRDGRLELADLDAVSLVNVEAINRYALSMQSPEGGFVGFSLDHTADVEYSFYGIATLALCQTYR